MSDDNAFSESLFKTLKYRPSYPRGPFKNIEDAKAWVTDFVKWYNTEHLHSGIGFVTPADRHARRDVEILKKRRAVYLQAYLNNPGRWIGKTSRFWESISFVTLNPINELADEEAA